MIGPDLVRARRRGDKLTLTPLTGTEQTRALELAAQLIATAKAHLDESHESVEAALSGIDREAREEKLFAGLRKLVMDACRFDAPLEIAAADLRRDLFVRAAAARQVLEVGVALDRDALIEQTAVALGVSAAQVEQGLFADLKGAQQMIGAPQLEATDLLERYRVAQIQGVLLRAVRVSVRLEESSPEAYRLLFFKLKFRQLLYRIERHGEGGYQIEIDGPFSLFDSVTKYGQKLALLVPVLLQVRRATLTAQLRWGKERRELTFFHEFAGAGDARAEESLSPEVRELVDALNARRDGTVARPTTQLLDLPGEGVIVPDFEVELPDGSLVLVEVMGFWSRDAVWRRVEWAEERVRRGDAQAERILFAVSSKLRVSEAVLPTEASAVLYVYKGRMSARGLFEQALRLCSAAP